ncbi:hypothetical protein DDQ50_03730 [Amnibacterium flavum]|uniref:SGNH hydrolase-type esterase domain-containing protein n=1 Tax=Amnibacterium flavum TaxID=2173173 RepID=A0A2V1HV61_9MICO|nr:hypothetical protein DDQ50_03730 [Amnibacterium flavum]
MGAPTADRGVDGRAVKVPKVRPDLRLLFARPDVVLGPIFWTLFRARTQDEREWFYPKGPPVISTGGDDPVQILVIGDGPAAGCGVSIHELGIAGFLARYVATDERRGVVVTVSAEPAASARSTLGGLQDIDLDRYDAIVLMLATTDAFCLTSRRSWRRSMTGLVQALASSNAPSVFVTGAASMQLTRSISPFVRGLTGRHARLLNFETRRICTRFGVPMIPLSAVNDLNSRTYAQWGRRIASHVCRALDGQGAAGRVP